ncbi:MAG: valine--pyruvate transaminase [Spirochaetales bacterium]|nr:MAG: valine--pyruvate transaminase [Spirochaetales bacterium]
MKRSILGTQFTSRTGILQLMDDLGKALAGTEKKYMLGGGNPAIIPRVASVWRRRMQEILDNPPQFDAMVGLYDTPQGRPRFLKAIASMLNNEYGWTLGPENIAVTNGSQSAFFMLLNLFAGETETGGTHQVVFPLMPEYIGYRDQPVGAETFLSFRPTIEQIDSHTHKYHIDFDALSITADAAAVCVSRPTNPSGNVLTDGEIRRLDELARAAGVPLIVDSAYGTPFPDIIFTEATPIWNENIVLSMSLSKVGLPSLRTGIVVARPEIVEALSAMNAILNLSTGSIGQALTEALFESGEILEISRSVIQPFYADKSENAGRYVEKHFAERFPYSVHKREGSLFLWIWFPDLPGTTVELYERLKKRDVIIVPGTYFFFGDNEPWEHKDRCIRVSYAMDEADVDHGIRVIAEEVELMWREHS